MKERLFSLLTSVARRLMATPLRKLPGARQIYEFIYQRLVSDEPVAVESEGNWIYVDPRDIGVSLYLITEGVYEPQLTQHFKRVLQPGMTFVDGGANVGYFSLLAAKLVGGSGRVFAFEPEPHNVELLRRSIERNAASNVALTQGALSDRAGTATLYLDRSNFGEPSLGKSNVTHPGGSVEVITVSLDEFLASQGDPKVDLIKLDTQGAEELVLAGAKTTLATKELKMVLEFYPWGLRNLDSDPKKLLATLRECGFSIAMLDDATGRLLSPGDEDIIRTCEEREGGRGFVSLILER